ncbi:MAG TPA: DUF3006 domain-containing protein [Clostridiales bacterium]|jgi:hypothetical protein|nr:DUF3006 domain-containing protein [Clostridiales bacterium]HRT81605.1 DUF3006 domain-containing protein [Oscillospiraceae bacterium]
MQRLTVDRFEGDFAVCEKEDRSILSLPISSLPKGTVEGSVLILFKNGCLALDKNEEKIRRKNIEDLYKKIFKDKD